MKYIALGEGLMTNISLSSPHAIFAIRLSPRAVYFIQTGSSALSITYCMLLLASNNICLYFQKSSDMLNKKCEANQK